MPDQKLKTDTVKKFEEIRDIPYHIAISGEKGSNCENKAKLLIEELQKLGFEARLRVGLFKWSDLNLPKDVTKFDHEDDCSHVFVDFKNSEGKWVYVDPTWNRELRGAGLRVTQWDGENSTGLALKCEKVLSPEDSEKYSKKIDYKADLKKNKDFYQAINLYCDSYLGVK